MKRILLSLMLLALTLNPVSVYADDKDKTFHFELGGEDWNHDTIAPGELLEDKVIVENATGYPLKFRLIRTENLHDSELYGVMKYSMGGSGFVDLADITSGWFQVADGERAEVPVVGYMPETLGNEWQGKELNARFYFEGRLVEESDMSNASYQESNYGLQDNNLKDTTGELHFADGFLFDNGVDLSDVLALESIGLYSADGTLIKEFMGVSQEEGGTGVDGYFYNFPITAEELRDIIDGNNSLEKTEDFYIQKTYRVIRDYEIVWTALSNWQSGRKAEALSDIRLHIQEIQNQRRQTCRISRMNQRNPKNQISRMSQRNPKNPANQINRMRLNCRTDQMFPKFPIIQKYPKSRKPLLHQMYKRYPVKRRYLTALPTMIHRG